MTAAPTRSLKRSRYRIAFRESVWSSDDLTAIEKLAALAYEDHVDEDHDLDSVWVTRRRLIQRTGLTTNRAQKAMRGLEAKGWIVLVEPGAGRRAARYRLVNLGSSVPDVVNATDEPSVPESARSVPEIGSSVPDVVNRPMTHRSIPVRPPRRSRSRAPTADEPRCSTCNQPQHLHGGHIHAYADHDYQEPQ